jgi:hypothetical protein
MSNSRRLKRRPPVWVTPEPYGSILDQVCEEDRRYFLFHPYETTYARPVVQFEFYPLEFAPGTQVVVRLLGPGRRSRRIDDLIVVDVDTSQKERAA